MIHTLERIGSDISTLDCRYYRQTYLSPQAFFSSFRHLDSNKATSVILYKGARRRNESLTLEIAEGFMSMKVPPVSGAKVILVTYY